MIARLLLQNTIFTAAMGALLFASAGTLRWPSAWVFLITSLLVGPLCGWWLYRIDPGLLAERLRPVIQRDQPGADKAFMIAFMAAILVWLIVIGLDRRAVASNVPLALQVLGFVLYLACTLFTMWVFRENSFAAPVVKLQAERGQHVISSGPYAHVRHPMYSGMLMFFAGVPLILGSWWGLAIAPILVLLIAVRISIEERTLIAGLSGYADYAARVRYRLMPGVW
ncbi:isoprenylcysteine carboxylmethyltransferase family protein [Bradyrhizobium sp. Gha]|uniref:methyltransferase family protein n=1 Tax=Bradyrhizobium sp. Gha TaxID=1855318 RepID=UPI0008E7AA47|nr:isoprenylcysteine carboxylmethyltransferase family protein [Bradyrhizobium sp. Gha]SFI18013.1 Protein-S-isoprenylcysteine O-methyltransferase Ste14 [Bradyrhizobium sp. Gha]